MKFDLFQEKGISVTNYCPSKSHATTNTYFNTLFPKVDNSSKRCRDRESFENLLQIKVTKRKSFYDVRDALFDTLKVNYKLEENDIERVLQEYGLHENEDINAASLPYELLTVLPSGPLRG